MTIYVEQKIQKHAFSSEQFLKTKFSSGVFF